MRDAVASDTGADDYNVESIVTEAGETTGTTTLMVVDDDLPDGGAGNWAAALLGSVDGVEISELTFIIWDAAVPALPVGGALLLWRGAVRTRGRDDVSLYAARRSTSRFWRLVVVHRLHREELVDGLAHEVGSVEATRWPGPGAAGLRTGGRRPLAGLA